MKIDMSPHAITIRLQRTSQLRDLCIALGGERFREKLKRKYADFQSSTEKGTSAIKESAGKYNKS